MNTFKRTWEYRGRMWHEIRREPYTRKRDGETIELIVWGSPCCAEGCSAMVEIFTPTTNYATSKAFGTKHCQTHKLTKEQTTKLWQTAIKEKKAQRDHRHRLRLGYKESQTSKANEAYFGLTSFDPK